MDYDATNIPAGYDQARSLGRELIELWMTTVAAHTCGRSVASILDLGCGTGRFSEALAARFNANVLVAASREPPACQVETTPAG